MGKYEYVVESESLGTGGAIKFASKDLKEEFLVLNGDILTDLNLSQFIETFQNSPFPNSIAIYRVSDPGGFGLVKTESDKVLGFIEKPTLEISEKEPNKFINAGIYILSPEVFKDIPQKSFLVEREVFPRLAAEGKLLAFFHKGFWQDIGTEERLEEVRKLSENKNF